MLAGALPEFVDPYLAPTSGVLRNCLGLTDSATLDRAEAQLVEARRAQMITRPIRITGDLRQLQAIHGQLFQDVYEWAGQLRTVDMRKGTDPAAEFFMPVSRLESGAGFAFAELREDKMLRGMDRERFVERLAHHYDQVNTGGSALLGCELYAYDLPPLDRARNGDRGVRPRGDHRIRGASAKASSSIERSP